MAKETKTVKYVNKEGIGGGLYLVTYIGAAVYFVSISEGFWGFVWALLKALVWPGFLVNRVFELLRI